MNLIRIRRDPKRPGFWQIYGGGFKPISVMARPDAEEIQEARRVVIIKRKLRKSLSTSERARLKFK